MCLTDSIRLRWNGGDSRACADLESYMSGFNDPRVRCYFQIPENWGGREIIGCRAGANVTNKDQAMQLYSAAKVEPTTKGVWMTAAEMTFCRAEGALKGWNMGGTPKDLYEKGHSFVVRTVGRGQSSGLVSD